MPNSKQPGPEITSQKTAGLILAGGVGRRFGCPKAFALLPDGRTFLEACVETMLQSGLKPIVTTLPTAFEGKVPPSVRPLQLPEPGLDMFASIKLGLQHLVEDLFWRKLIILPVDHPLVRPQTIAALMNQEYPAAIPTLNTRHGHPILISRRIAEGIVNGHLSGPTLREVLRTAPAHDVPVDDRGIRANCNTPDALSEAWSTVRLADFFER